MGRNAPPTILLCVYSPIPISDPARHHELIIHDFAQNKCTPCCCAPFLELDGHVRAGKLENARARSVVKQVQIACFVGKPRFLDLEHFELGRLARLGQWPPSMLATIGHAQAHSTHGKAGKPDSPGLPAYMPRVRLPVTPCDRRSHPPTCGRHTRPRGSRPGACRRSRPPSPSRTPGPGWPGSPRRSPRNPSRAS